MNKRIFYVLITLMILNIGCKKDNPPAPLPTPVTTLSFKANGELVRWDGSSPLGTIDGRGGSTIAKYPSSNPANPAHYMLFSVPPGNHGIYGPLLALKMVTTNLVVGTYTLATPATVPWGESPHICFLPDGKLYGTTEAGDYATIHITKVQDGYVDGNFTALMSFTTFGVLYKLNITEGQFKNVKIEY